MSISHCPAATFTPKAPPSAAFTNAKFDTVISGYSLITKFQAGKGLAGKPGQEYGLWAEGFFLIDLLLLFYQEKRSSLSGDERLKR